MTNLTPQLESKHRKLQAFLAESIKMAVRMETNDYDPEDTGTVRTYYARKKRLDYNIEQFILLLEGVGGDG